jgi:hypothetical protein
MPEELVSTRQVLRQPLSDRLNRLACLSGTDEGFFVLALHSFVERYAHEADPLLRYEERFPELVWGLGEILKERRQIPHDNIKPLVRIIKEHRLTHRVRHDFERLDREEALAAIHNFLGFCAVCAISDPALQRFRESLKLWDEKTPPAERGEQLRRMQRQLIQAQKENACLVEKLDGMAAEQNRIAELSLQIRRLSADLDQERLRAAGKSERVDRLREELNALRLQRQELQKSLERYQGLEQYLEYLDRFTLYTRTRADYERSVTKLTPEQQEVMDGIDLSHDFLVKGGAGTGKTLVLLHALGRLSRQQAAELVLEPARRTVLLTFTNTLVKYDRYLAEIMGAGAGERQVQTADSFFLARLKAIDSRYWVDYEAMRRLSKELNSTDFMSRIH